MLKVKSKVIKNSHLEAYLLDIAKRKNYPVQIDSIFSDCNWYSEITIWWPNEETRLEDMGNT